jgi:hypothetical protein
LNAQLAQNLHLGTFAVQFKHVAWGQLRGRQHRPYVAPDTIDRDWFRYDGVMDAHVRDSVAGCRLLRKPDVLFASLKALNGA